MYLYVKGRACVRISKPAYCFHICGSAFGVLFCLLDGKLVLGSNIIWQSIREFFTVWTVGTFPRMDKEEMSFFL